MCSIHEASLRLRTISFALSRGSAGALAIADSGSSYSSSVVLSTPDHSHVQLATYVQPNLILATTLHPEIAYCESTQHSLAIKYSQYCPPVSRPMNRSLPTKDCIACGRIITWRKKWERSWASLKYCGDKCRRIGVPQVGSTDLQLETTILTLLSQGAKHVTICPSQAARQVGGDAWRDLMEPARAAARRLVSQGKIIITQGGHEVDPSTAKGPIRLRRA